MTRSSSYAVHDNEITFPSACLAGMSLADCAALADYLAVEAGTASCELVGENCECTQHAEITHDEEVWSYSTSGGVMTLHEDSYPDVVHQYCVQGDLAAVVHSDSDYPYALILQRQ